MDVRRSLAARRAAAQYLRAVEASVATAPGRLDVLHVVWAHRVAWAALQETGADELELLSQTTSRYGVALDVAVHELRHQREAPPVVPAARAAEPVPGTAAASALPPGAALRPATRPARRAAAAGRRALPPAR